MKAIMVATITSILSLAVLAPVAYALTPRSDFGDNISTYSFLGGTKVCGDHVCKLGEWNKWVSNMFFSQIQKFTNSFGNTAQDKYIKSASYDTSSLIDGTSNGKITKVSTFAMNDGKYTTFVTITDTGFANANYIALTQLNPDVKIIKAWISPQWDSNTTLYKTVFNTSKTALVQGDTLNIIFVTDGKPAFSLDALGSSR
ncbi:exported hypothetical protein [Nitrosotalea sinensis]|jgi:hypothetical protein|uniref:Uncharacterized protein n=1 Tax=Nitrosotalea sinensis TaxID=1499975 RepID=A0A2H1EH22_9ARCH|nr:hypothetical protein [Candidatus Nitrosotalea sinensis]SHO45583.1 exported hypothetical protein [Candidatus Nitrosotalea sinensis]